MDGNGNAQATLERVTVPQGHAVETGQLIDLLKGGVPGDIFTDEQMTETCGKDTRPNCAGYNYLRTAIRYCIDHHAVVWARIREAHSIKCLSASERTELGDSRRKHIHRASKRTMSVLAAVNIGDLDDEERISHHAMVAQMGTIAMFSSTGTQKKLVARKVSEKPDVQRLLEMMK